MNDSIYYNYLAREYTIAKNFYYLCRIYFT